MTASDRTRRVEELFHAALQQPPLERSAFVRDACRGDGPLESRVLSLLDSYSESESFLREPLLEEGALQEVEFRARDLEEETLGQRIGAYKIVERVGAGGMGAVFRAERDDDAYEKQVAVKVIRRGMESEATLRSFRRERQALADLDHPNIARLLDGGETSDGLPYLIMEYVSGESICEHANHRGLSIMERLHLFQQVCAGVRYAHQNLVVHRDLKPHNTLVTEDGQAKLLDFGIAKLIQEHGSKATTGTTVSTARFYTLPYASPEQIQGGPISTGTDVYSLGVILYELLTQKCPYPPDTRTHELEHLICHEEPPRPSLVDPRLRGDLDHIVAKAMRKEPDQRYQSVEQFSEDIRRHCVGLPIFARKGTVRYRLSRFVKRHSTGVAATLVVALALVAGIVATRMEARRARTEATAAKNTRAFLVELYRSLDPNARHHRREVRETLESPRVDELVSGLRDVPEQKIHFLDALASVGERYHLYGSTVGFRSTILATLRNEEDRSRFWSAHADLGLAQLRSGQIEAAIETLTRAADAGHHESMVVLAEALHRQGDRNRPESLIRQALEESAAPRSEWWAQLARLLTEYGRMSEAVEAATVAMERAEGPVEEATHQSLVGRTLWATPRFGDAESLVRNAHARLSKLLGKHHHAVAEAKDALARIIGSSRGGPAATVLCTEALRDRASAFGPDSLVVADSRATLSRLLGPLEGDPHAQGALRIYEEKLSEGDPRQVEVLLQMARVRAEEPDRFAGSSEARAKLFAEGRARCERALDLIDRATKVDTWQLATALSLIAVFDAHTSDGADAVEKSRHAVEISRRCLGADHPRTRAIVARARLCYQILGDRVGEGELTDEDLTGRPPVFGGIPTHPRKSYTKRPPANFEFASIDYDDDYAEKLIPVARLPKGEIARLWVLGQPYNYIQGDFEDREDYRLRVNGREDQVIPFDVGAKFAYVEEVYQWVSFEVPVEWLREGQNSFAFFEAATEWKGRFPRPWEVNNLHLAIDPNSDDDCSWWYGNAFHCCEELILLAKEKSVPQNIIDHRPHGLAACRGELYVWLEGVE